MKTPSSPQDTCSHCEAPLRGKQTEFCSVGCKAKSHRRQRTRQAEHLSITAAALELGISRHAVRYAIDKGRLRAIQVPTAGRPRLEVTRGEVERYRAGRPIRRQKPKPGEVDAEIRLAVAEMVGRVRTIAKQAFTHR